MRTLLLWCPDWPVIAAGLVDGVDVHRPVVVLAANRVYACSPAARAEGIRRGLRKREAQGRCPQVTVVEHDPGRDARAYEPVVAVIEELAPGVEVIRSGACAVAVRGPASYYGSEAAAAERLVEQVAVHCGVEAQAGVADGVFAALLAARVGLIVPPGGTTEFLSTMDIEALDRPELADLLRRLGIRTLGDFAALPAADVLARFGFDAAYAHRQAAGVDERPLAVRTPPADLDVAEAFDPPLDRVDMAAFAGRALAERLQERLAGHGLAATRLGIEARTEAGEELYRVWRHEGLLDAAAIADRVRWQLDGWLTAAKTSAAKTARARAAVPTAGIAALKLVPEGIVRHAGLQPGLWGEPGAAEARAHRALVRVQGLLGPDAVLTPVLGGGRSYADRIRLVPWGDERTPNRKPDAPWPGQLPAPAPATVPERPVPADVRTADGRPVEITARLAMTGPPATVTLPDSPAISGKSTRQGPPNPAISRKRPGEVGPGEVGPAGPGGAGETREVTAWAGPWPVEERWWAPEEASRRVRLQVLLDDGTALLLSLTDGGWWVEGSYD